MNLIVSEDGLGSAVLRCGADAFRAAIGAGGIGIKKAEGDKVTPLGVFPIRRILYRSDRIARPVTGVALEALSPDDGWCDAPNDVRYNRQVKLPYGASAEALWRTDHLYDLVVVLGFNDSPVVSGAGSAIFIHVARDDFGPTAGCVALALADLQNVVARLSPGDVVSINP